MPNPELIETRKQELLSYVQNFYRKSWDWRSTRLHEKWNRCDRNYHSIYDPTLAGRKEPWQSRMFLDITLQNVEIIVSQIHKTMMAPKPPIQTEAGPAGDELQARLVQEVMAYELRKGDFEISFYDALKESVKYGSGFVKFFWQRVVDTRRRRTPIEQTPDEVIQGAPLESLVGQAPMPRPNIKGFEMGPQEVVIKNNLMAKYVHIRDIFPEPNSTTWDKGIHRDKIPYGTIVAHIKRGEFFDVRDELEDVIEGEKFEEDTRDIKQERGYFEVPRELSKFEKKHTIWEMWNEIPRKWIEFDIEEGDDAEELVPAKVMVASGVALLASEANEKFDGEWPVLKMDYIRTGESYGKGICEMLFDDQDEINEHSNLGIDNMNLIINKMMAVFEAALVNAEQDLVSKPGGIVRLKAQMNDDIRKVIMPIEFPDLASSFFKHRFDIERMVQEKTGANRVTLGSSGMVKDTNQTLGGMELLRQMFNERVAAYGMVIEAAFLLKAAEKAYGIIYQELGEQGPEMLKPILGDEPVTIGERPDPMTGKMIPFQVPRFMAFAFVPPEELNKSYRFKPMGIFSLENKIVKVAQVLDLIKIAGPDPRFDRMKALEYVAVTLQQIDEAEKWFLDLPSMPGMPGMPPMAGPGGAPPMPNAKETPGLKGGPNGNQPSFLPPNPLRREPVVS
jgi:hypothetical protein